jgi:tetratricopeptide (TPR) repeat protein
MFGLHHASNFNSYFDCPSMSLALAAKLQMKAWGLHAQGYLDEARADCHEALQLTECAAGENLPDVANLLNDLAEIESARQNYKIALDLATRARAIEDCLGATFSGEDAARIRIKTSTLLGEQRRILGQTSTQHPDLVDALDLAASTFGDDSQEAAEARNNLAVAYKYAGRFDEALQLYERALKIITAIFGTAPSLPLRVVHHNIGGIYHAMGDFEAAKSPGKLAWDMSRRLLGDTHLQTQLDAAAYAAILDGLGRYQECESLYRAALVVMLCELGAQHPEVAALQHNLASVLAVQGNTEEAERRYRLALQIKDSVFGPQSADAALTRISLGGVLNSCHQYGEAEKLLAQARDVLIPQVQSDHPHLTVLERHLAVARSHLPS